MYNYVLITFKMNEMSTSENFNYIVEQFADLQLLRYRVDGFENLSLKQKN